MDQGRAAPQGVSCRQPNLTLSVVDSTARTRDILITWRQPYRCSKAPLPYKEHNNDSKWQTMRLINSAEHARNDDELNKP